MTKLPPSSPPQGPVLIHPQLPGMSRNDAGIQTGSNNSVDSSKNKAHPVFNSRLNTYEGAPIPPVLRQYQLHQQQMQQQQPILVQQNENDNESEQSGIFKIYYHRKLAEKEEDEYLCTFEDTCNFHFASWISQTQLVTAKDGVKKLHQFNQSPQEMDFFDTLSMMPKNNPLSPVEIMCKINDRFLFRYRFKDYNVFCWDNPSGKFYEGLIQDFYHHQNMQRLPLKMTEGVQFILDSVRKQSGLIFCGEKSDITEFLSIYTDKAVVVVNDNSFEWWCNQFEEKNINYVGYNGDDFTRGIIRQYKVVNNMILLLITYSALISDFRYLSDIEFTLLIADNAEKLKKQQGRKRSAVDCLNSKIKIALCNKLDQNNVSLMQNFVKNSGLIFLPKKIIPKYIFLRPTDYQLAFLASKPFEAQKICQNGMLIDSTCTDFVKLSSKFLFLGKISRNSKDDSSRVTFVFQNKKLLSLFEKYLFYQEIPFKSPSDPGAEAFVTLCSNDNLVLSGTIFAVDCDINIENYYRLVLYGTREHYFLSKSSIERNLEKFEISIIPAPPLITFDYPNMDFESIIKTSGSLVEAPVFNFQSLGISEFLEKAHIKAVINDIFMNGFKYDQPIYYVTILALFRALKPENVILYSLSVFKLVNDIPNFDSSILFCGQPKEWIKPLKKQFQIDFTPFKELQNHFFNSAEKVIQRIEYNLISSLYFQYNQVFQIESRLPPSYRITKEDDNRIVQKIKNHIFIENEPRVVDIINAMKSDLILNNCLHANRILYNFWTKKEVEAVINVYVNFGGYTHSAKTALLSKSNENIQLLTNDIAKFFSNHTPFRINVSIPKEFGSIPNTIEIDEDEMLQYEFTLNISKAIRNVIEHNCSHDSFTPLLQDIARYGTYNFRDLLIIALQDRLTRSDIDFLTGKHPLWDPIAQNNEKSSIPEFFLTDFKFLQYLRHLSKPQPQIQMQAQPHLQHQVHPQIQPQIQIQPLPSTQPSQTLSSGRNYSPPKDLLQRAADLQHLKLHEKKSKPGKQVANTNQRKAYGNVSAHIKKEDPSYILHPVQPQIPTHVDQEQGKTQYFLPRPDLPTRPAEFDRQSQLPKDKSLHHNVHFQQQQMQNVSILPSNLTPPKKRPISNAQSPNHPQQQYHPQSHSHQHSHEPPKAANVRKSKAAARQMINEDFLKTLPHKPRTNHQTSSQQTPQQPQIIQTNPVQTTSNPSYPSNSDPQNTYPADISLLPPKKKPLLKSPS